MQPSDSHSHDHDHTFFSISPDLSSRHSSHDHGHSHTHLSHAGEYGADQRGPPKRKFNQRAFCIGIGGPVGTGKTALMLALCLRLREKYNLCAVTNDIFTKEDAEFLVKHEALSADRICAVETGGCPHAAIREDITANLLACEELTARHRCDLLLLESGGDNLAADFSRELADFTIYVIDTAGGDKVPRKGGPGITQSDLLVINKVDLAPAVGASLEVLRRDATLMRTSIQSRERGNSNTNINSKAVVGPWVFAQVGGTLAAPSPGALPPLSPHSQSVLLQTQPVLADAAAEGEGVCTLTEGAVGASGYGVGLGVEEIVSHIETALAAAGVLPRSGSGNRTKTTSMNQS